MLDVEWQVGVICVMIMFVGDCGMQMQQQVVVLVVVIVVQVVMQNDLLQLLQVQQVVVLGLKYVLVLVLLLVQCDCFDGLQKVVQVCFDQESVVVEVIVCIELMKCVVVVNDVVKVQEVLVCICMLQLDVDFFKQDGFKLLVDVYFGQVVVFVQCGCYSVVLDVLVWVIKVLGNCDDLCQVKVCYDVLVDIMKVCMQGVFVVDLFCMCQ